MSNRITRVTTRGGDSGTTGLADGTRRPKCDLRIGAIGDVDELNSCLGVLLCEALPDDIAAALTWIQHRLFDLGGQLALPGTVAVGPEQVQRLDAWIESWNARLPALTDFVLPGGNRRGALAQLARAVARRAERAIWALHAVEPLDGAALKFVNRLSDLLFIGARRLVIEAGDSEKIWARD